MTSLHVHELGQGDAVLLLHGSPSPATGLLPLAEALAHQYRVLVPDLPGYGASPALPEYSLDSVCALLETMLTMRGIERVRVVGFSGGAYRALALALRGRIAVESLVTIAGFASLPDDARAQFHGLAALLRAQPEAVRDPAMRDLMGKRMLSPAYAAAHPDKLREASAWLDLLPPAVLADELDGFAGCPDLRAELRGLQAPVLALVGEIDVAAPVGLSEELAAAAPRGTLDVVRGAGHALLWEAPERTITAVQRALLV